MKERRGESGYVERPHWIDSITNEEAEVLLKTKDKPKKMPCETGERKQNNGK